MQGVFPYLDENFIKNFRDVGLGNVMTLNSTSQR